MQNIREQLAQIMTENNPVGLLDELQSLFVLYSESQELNGTEQRAYADAARQLDNARSEFLRRGIR